MHNYSDVHPTSTAPLCTSLQNQDQSDGTTVMQCPRDCSFPSLWTFTVSAP